MSKNTELPATHEDRQAKALSYLDHFSTNITYRHRQHNKYLGWLQRNPALNPDAMYRFFNFWYPVSRHQPQILYLIAAACPDWKDRRLIFLNNCEEDGMLNEGDEPHYDLLEKLIVKLGGSLDVDPEAEKMVCAFHRTLNALTPAQTVGILAAIEHPALDISDYFQLIARLAGRPELLKDDLYLSIHIDVEPKHIIWSHGNMLDWIEDREKQKREGYTALEVTEAFQHAMSFWDNFWKLAFEKLGYKE